MKRSIFILYITLTCCSHSNAGPTGDAIAQGLRELKGPALATVAVNLPVWTYTVTNNAPKESGLTINSFNFDLYGPAEPVHLPNGWKVDTDGRKYILWSTEKNGIRPGESLKFELKSKMKKSQDAFAIIIAWNNKTGKAGPVSTSVVKIPSNK